MTTLMSLLVKLGVDSGDFDKGLGDAEKKTASFADSMKATGDKIMKTGAGLTAGLTLPIAGAATAMVNAASDLAESTNAVNVVFGEASDAIHDFGKTAAQQAGLATSEFNQMAAQTGAFLKNVGFSAEGAADQTIDLTKRAADMASIFNTDVSQALAAIQSGLKGEFNPLEAFGVKLNAATIEARALQMGLEKTTVDMLEVARATSNVEKAERELAMANAWYGDESIQARDAAITLAEKQQKLSDVLAGGKSELTDAAKAQAALALVMEQTDQFAGDFVNTSDGLANSTRILKAELTNSAAALGEKLLPYVLQGVQFVGRLIDKFTELGPSGQNLILIGAAILAAIGPVMTIIGGLITGIGMLSWPIVAIGAAIALLAVAWTQNWGDIQGKTAELWAWLQPILQDLWNWLQINVPIALQALADFWTTTLLPAIQAVGAWITGTLFPALSALWTWLSTNIPAAISALAGFWTNTLLPPIMAVVDWINAHLVPLFQAFFGAWLEGWKLQLQVFAGIWQNYLGQALSWVAGIVGDYLVWAFGNLTKIIEFLWPILQKIGQYVGEYVSWAFGNLTKMIDGVTSAIQWMADGLSKITLPDWLTPGSPTPFELGLLGINEALKAVTQTGLPDLQMGVNAQGLTMPLPSITTPQPATTQASQPQQSGPLELSPNSIAAIARAFSFELQSAGIGQ